MIRSQLRIGRNRSVTKPVVVLKTFLNKIAIAARLFGKELQRNKLKWFVNSRTEQPSEP